MAQFHHVGDVAQKNRVLLPGVSVLARQVSEARTAAKRRLYEAVARAAHRADPALAPAPAELLTVPEGKPVSELGRLRIPPTRSKSSRSSAGSSFLTRGSAAGAASSGKPTPRRCAASNPNWDPVVSGLPGEGEGLHRGDLDVEGVLRPAAVREGVRQRTDQVTELQDGPRPAVAQQQGKRQGVGRACREWTSIPSRTVR